MTMLCRNRFSGLAVAAFSVLVFSSAAAWAEPGNVLDEQKISDDAGGFGGDPDPGDFFGYGVASIGDLNGDGVGDIAVGVPFADDAGADAGAVYIVFLDEDGRVIDEQRISRQFGGFNGIIGDGDEFGVSVAYLGDLDGDGVGDIAVGAPGDDDGSGMNAGAVWILFLNEDGTVKAEQKISDTEGEFEGPLPEEVAFGFAIAPIGDFNDDGVMDIAVGMPLNDDGSGQNAGGFYILFLNADGTVSDYVEITDTEGDFEGALPEETQFGHAIACLGDLDLDGVTDLAVGAPFDDDGNEANSGAVWILFMNDDGTVRDEQKLSDQAGGLIDFNNLSPEDLFGYSLSSADDVNGDGIQDLFVGAPLDDDGSGSDNGAAYFLFLKRDGTAAGIEKISDTQGGLGGSIDSGDAFGTGVAVIDDLDGDGVREAVAGAPADNDGGGVDSGAVWVMFIEGPTTLCGDTSGDLARTVVDAQILLNASVGIGECELCICDVDGSETVLATDSLRVLNVSVGLDVGLSCSVCD